MKKALDMSRDIPPFRLAFSMKTLVKMQGFLPVFENAISHQRQTLLGNQARRKGQDQSGGSPESQNLYYAFSQGHEYGDNQGRVASGDKIVLRDRPGRWHIAVTCH